MVVAHEGVGDGLVRHAPDSLQQFLRMTGMKGLENGDTLVSNNEHRVVSLAYRETVDAIADLTHDFIFARRESHGGRGKERSGQSEEFSQ